MSNLSPSKRKIISINSNLKQSPSKRKINIIINNNYLEKLKNDIHILDEELFALILKYIDDSFLDRYFTLTEINKYLKEINYLHVNENNENKIKKIHELKAHGLIECIIHSTLNYYNSDISVKMSMYKNKIGKINSKSSKYIMQKMNLGTETSEYIIQKMNLGTGILLSECIIETYNSNKNKNNLLLKILQKIAEELNNLQKSCKFIHGDFHSKNIFIDIIENDIKVVFIDFGYSVISLPCNKNILLAAPVDVNINRKNIMDLAQEPLLKALDMFHLIEELKTFEMTKNKFNNPEFFSFINMIRDLYLSNFNINLLKKYKSRHEFTASADFFEKKDYSLSNSFEYLFPENFMKLEFNKELITSKIVLNPVFQGFKFENSSPKRKRNPIENNSSFQNQRPIENNLSFQNQNPMENNLSFRPNHSPMKNNLSFQNQNPMENNLSFQNQRLIENNLSFRQNQSPMKNNSISPKRKRNSSMENNLSFRQNKSQNDNNSMEIKPRSLF